MALRSLQIRNYRAICEGSLTFDRTSVLFGENDSGRSSIIEALLLLLGSPEERFETRLRPLHFHRGPEGTAGPLGIQIRIGEQVPGEWSLPECLKRVLPADPGRRLELDFEFQAGLSAAGAIECTWSIRAAGKQAPAIVDSREALEWLRGSVPVFYLKPGSLSSGATRGAAASAKEVQPSDPALSALERHHRNLVTGDAVDMFSELEAGARAAQTVLAKFSSIFAGAGLQMGAMAADILNRRPVSAAATHERASTAAQKIGATLLLGALLQIVRRNVVVGSRPVLIIENPETDLHPMTLAAVWSIIERINLQKVVATNSGDILASAPLSSIRRLTRGRGVVREWSVHPRALTKDALRRVSYHLRSRRASAMFARCWLLVEGETEYWMIPELARICGYDFAVEGVACVEFAQCGIPPLRRLADELGIGWHVLADGDAAGQHYAAVALKEKGSRRGADRTITLLRERDIEHCFWQNGFADVIRLIADPSSLGPRGTASTSIKKAVERTSKPFVALSLIDAAAERGPRSIPAVLRQTIQACIAQARSAPDTAIADSRESAIQEQS